MIEVTVDIQTATVAAVNIPMMSAIIGVPGPIGPAGQTGAQGAQGPQGQLGAQGPKGDTGASGVWVQMTQAAYTALPTKDPNVLYVLVG